MHKHIHVLIVPTNMHCITLDGVPPDGTPITVHILIHGAIITLQFLMSGVTLACILVCFVFTLIFKKRK